MTIFKINKLNENIVSTEFKYNNEENILVTLPNEICL
jgi:hypothetical protein